jgi:hypothetical protein
MLAGINLNAHSWVAVFGLIKCEVRVDKVLLET